MDERPSNIVELSVSELAFSLKRTVEDAYSLVRVRGELSGFKRAASGHLYFSMKDDRASIDAVCWRNAIPRLTFQPEDGLEIVCNGRLTTYPGRSKYQIVVETMEPAGVGALMALLEERKRRLEAEGLFAAERKRPLPYLPTTIGLVTSPTGAVIRDILHRLRERFAVRVILWPVAVQGEGAAAQITAAIDGLNALARDGVLPTPDLLIVARGGGSIEDLWPFNEESVARAAAASSIPLISAVGHETDTTLIDFVADKRAPTPTAAAEMAVPVRRDLVLQVTGIAERLRQAADRDLRHRRERLDGQARGLTHPRHGLGLALQRLDDLSERLRLRSPSQIVEAQRSALKQKLSRLRELVRDQLDRRTREITSVASRLTIAPVSRSCLEGNRALHREAHRLDKQGRALIERETTRLAHVSSLLESLSHERALERGYVIVTDERSEALVTSREEAREVRRLVLCFKDGRLTVQPAGAGTRRTASDARGAHQEVLPI